MSKIILGTNNGIISKSKVISLNYPWSSDSAQISVTMHNRLATSSALTIPVHLCSHWLLIHSCIVTASDEWGCLQLATGDIFHDFSVLHPTKNAKYICHECVCLFCRTQIQARGFISRLCTRLMLTLSSSHGPAAYIYQIYNASRVYQSPSVLPTGLNWICWNTWGRHIARACGWPADLCWVQGLRKMWGGFHLRWCNK